MSWCPNPSRTISGGPSVVLADPGANVSGTVTLTASTSAGTDHVIFQRAVAGSGTWTDIATDSSAPFSAALNTTSLSDGSYDLRAVGFDTNGYSGTSNVRTSLVDNTKPTGTLTAPAAGEKLAVRHRSGYFSGVTE